MELFNIQYQEVDCSEPKLHNMAPENMKAIKIIKQGDGQAAELQTVPVPKLRDDYVLCKVNCVALNPTDWLVRSCLDSQYVSSRH